LENGSVLDNVNSPPFGPAERIEIYQYQELTRFDPFSGFGLRWQAKRDTALGEDLRTSAYPPNSESAVAAVHPPQYLLRRTGALPAQSKRTRWFMVPIRDSKSGILLGETEGLFHLAGLVGHDQNIEHAEAWTTNAEHRTPVRGDARPTQRGISNIEQEPAEAGTTNSQQTPALTECRCKNY
jgi:hypothetical protein